jgi:hypothetical protein
MREGPFTKQLPDGLAARGIDDVNLGDASAAGAVDAKQVLIDVDANNDMGVTGVFAHYEVHKTSEAATERANERIALLKRIVGEEKVQGGAASYCSYETIRGPISWECGGTSGLVHVETTITPNSNATQYLAAEATAAILGYADEKARLAME